MPVVKLVTKLVLYYAGVTALVLVGLWLFPGLREYLPIGRVQSLISEAGGATSKADAARVAAAQFSTLSASLVWLTSAVGGALVTSLPISWVYMEVRDRQQYDQSLVDTIIILPLVVTGIVVIVQHSLALSFSLAGIAGAARFRNSMKSSGDLLFILLAIGIGLSTGIGAMELAIVMSMAFNFAFVALWATKYGARKGMKPFLGGYEAGEHGKIKTAAEGSREPLSPVL
jgi:hypothetical protein